MAAMLNVKNGLLAALACAVAAAAPSAGCRGGQDKKNKAEDGVVSVVAAEARRQAYSSRLELVGQLKASETVDVAARTGGQLESVVARIGDRVRKGDLLARLDDELIGRQAEEAGAAVAMAEAQVEQARVAAELKASDLRRLEPLAERGLASAQEIEAVRGAARSATAQLQVAEAGAAQARARRANLRRQLSDLSLRAPFDGAIGARFADPGANVAPNQPIVRIVRDGPLTLSLDIPENDSRFAAGEVVAVEVRADALPGRTIAARLARSSAMVDPVKRSIAAEAVVEEPAGVLLPGMFARATLALSPSEKLVIPSEALLADPTPLGAGGRFPASGEVYVISGDLARKRRIVVGDMHKNITVVESGLRAGERVVIEGAANLSDGAAVNVVGGREAPADVTAPVPK